MQDHLLQSQRLRPLLRFLKNQRLIGQMRLPQGPCRAFQRAISSINSLCHRGCNNKRDWDRLPSSQGLAQQSHLLLCLTLTPYLPGYERVASKSRRVDLCLLCKRTLPGNLHNHPCKVEVCSSLLLGSLRLLLPSRDHLYGSLRLRHRRLSIPE